MKRRMQIFSNCSGSKEMEAKKGNDLHLEDSGSDLEENGDERRLLVRYAGQYKRVKPVVESKVWEIKDLVVDVESMEPSQISATIKNEEEKERTRRMSVPYGACIDITDVHWNERSRRLSSVHEDLFKLFAIHTALAQQQSEQQRLMTEAKKQLVLQELERMATRKAVKEAVELERLRRIKMLLEMADGNDENTSPIANTNMRLVAVHDELKKTFQYLWEEKAAKEKEKLELSKESFQTIKRAVGRKFSLELEGLLKHKMKQEENLRITDDCYQMVAAKMIEVQQELFRVFENFKKRVKHLSTVSKRKTYDTMFPVNANEIAQADDFVEAENNLEFSKGVIDQVKREKAKKAESKERERRLSETFSKESLAEKVKLVDSFILIHREIQGRQKLKDN